MSDLISRETVIDILKQTGIIQDNDIGHCVIEEINRIPIAYDIDKVVEKLKCDRCESCNFIEVCAGSKYCGKCHENAIEIVKQGCASDDDVCEWTKSKDYPFDWFVGCDGCEVNHKQGDYCPRCGKKIKVVE